MSPVVSEGVVYSGGDAGRLHAVDLESGQELWSADVGEEIRYSIAVAGDLVFANGDKLGENLHAIDRHNGETVWTRENVGRAGMAVEDNLYTVGNQCHAVDPVTGDTLWSREINTHELMYPAYGDGKVYVGADAGSTGSIYALDPETGDEIWSYYPGTHAGPSTAPPTYSDGVVYRHGK